MKENVLTPTKTALREHWAEFDKAERDAAFASLAREEAEEVFMSLPAHDQYDLFFTLSPTEQRLWLRLLALDDLVDLLQQMDAEERADIISLLPGKTQREVTGLLAYKADEAGGLMTPHYVRLRLDMTVGEAFSYLRAQSKTTAETIYYAYVLDEQQKLVGVVSFRDLILAPPKNLIQDIMRTDLVTVTESTDREDVSYKFSHYDLMAVPVVDEAGIMKGIVTYDDIGSVVQQEATEDMQKAGGMEALDAPYFNVGFWGMIRKRAGWLVMLFLGEMFTASAMGYYETQIERAVVLALFIPLIISSGGNSGSQASSLIIRALALHEVHLRDWLKVFMRELSVGLSLGLILAFIGGLRVIIWQHVVPTYGEHYWYIAGTVSLSLIGVVLWGTISGAMLPFLLKRLGFDPASASAPFVATLVDVTGLVIYFSVATILLKGILL